MWNRPVPHPCVVDKNLGGVAQEQGVQPHTRPPVHGSSVRKIRPNNLWLQKKQQRLSQWKKLLEPQAVSLKEPTHGLTYTDSLSLSYSTRIAA